MLYVWLDSTNETAPELAVQGPRNRLLLSPVDPLFTHVGVIAFPFSSVTAVDTWMVVPALKTAWDPLASPKTLNSDCDQFWKRFRTPSVSVTE